MSYGIAVFINNLGREEAHVASLLHPPLTVCAAEKEGRVTRFDHLVIEAEIACGACLTAATSLDIAPFHILPRHLRLVR